jgi:hypothetical protein
MRIAKAMVSAAWLVGLTSSEAMAQEGPEQGAPTESPPTPVASAPPASATAPVAPPTPAVEATGHVSLALERVGGLAYGSTSASKTNATATTFVLGVAGERADPNTVPRVGVDYVFASGLSLGVGAGVSHLSGTASQGADPPSLFSYTAVGRVGYRIVLSERVDLTPRGGVSIGGASTGSGSTSVSETLVAGDLEAPLAFRLTPSFNFVLAPELVAGSWSGTIGVSNVGSQDVSASFWSLGAWLGIGGYL